MRAYADEYQPPPQEGFTHIPCGGALDLPALLDRQIIDAADSCFVPRPPVHLNVLVQVDLLVIDDSLLYRSGNIQTYLLYSSKEGSLTRFCITCPLAHVRGRVSSYLNNPLYSTNPALYLY
jgi:hypothetical protein